jgi:thiamine biosynthesis lipoprotein
MEFRLNMPRGATSLPETSASAGSGSSDCQLLFRAMATPCEIRIECDDRDMAQRAARAGQSEARRVEAKFSRYIDGSVVGRINASCGHEVEMDDETAHLLNFAQHLFEVSGGLFDITSGVLRRIWRFDGSDRVPAAAEVNSLLTYVGWQKVMWNPPVLKLPVGAEIDFGGLGKEYAVDRALHCVSAMTTRPALVNFGGDLRVSGPRNDDRPWKVAIESVDHPGCADAVLELHTGALATSGDSRRFLLKDGVRYGHILDPRTGWPVQNPLRSVTVAAPTCTEAGMLATLAILKGANAEAFLKREHIKAWYVR